MKYTINGYSQEKLLKNNLDLSDSIILRVLADIYSSNGKKIEYKIINNDKYMWISYGYLFEQIPIIGSERTLVRKIDSLIEKGMLKKELVTSKKGIKGRFLYISFGEKYFKLTEYSNNTKETEEEKEEAKKPNDKLTPEDTKCQIDTNQMTKCQGPNDKLTSHQMTKCHNKDSSIDNTSINNNILNNIYSQVINYLNEKANSKYKATSKDNQKHIKARINEGYGFDDFKKVVDNMCSAWKNTEFENYLRPSTLFGVKFENYLNWKKTGGNNNANTGNKRNYTGNAEKKRFDKHNDYKPDYSKGFDDWN